MKTHFRFYTSKRTAKLSYQGRELSLVNGMQFQLGEQAGRPVVIQDGFRYPVNPKMLPELKRRSEVAKPSNDYVAGVQSFDKLGHTLLKWVTHWIKQMSNDFESGFKQNQVFAVFTERGDTKYALQVTPTALHASVYAPVKQQVHVAKLNEAVHKIAARMKKEFGADVGDFRDMTSHVSNVGTPWGPFSGTIYSHSAKWSIK